MTETIEHKIVISPIGDIDDRLIHTIVTGVNRTFRYPVAIRAILENVDFALDRKRGQYGSTPILEKLHEQAFSNEIKILAVTDVDLFIPILTYVFGEAQLGGKACIVSIHRLKKGMSPVIDNRTIHERIEKESIHELGHTFNLRHCKDPSCIMHYCRGIEDVDLKSGRFCRYCRIMADDEIKRLATKALRH